MKTLIKITLLTSFLLSSCFSSKIFEKEDIVYGTKRYELKLIYHCRDRNTSLLYTEQSLVKEVSAKGNIYHIYDALVLSSLGYKLDEKVFILIDNQAYPVKIESRENENTKDITETHSDVPTSDSTTVSVVTGYSENNRKITRFSYSLSEDIVAKIKTAKNLSFRYYAGPDMITVIPDMSQLKKIKELL